MKVQLLLWSIFSCFIAFYAADNPVIKLLLFGRDSQSVVSAAQVAKADVPPVPSGEPDIPAAPDIPMAPGLDIPAVGMSFGEFLERVESGISKLPEEAKAKAGKALGKLRPYEKRARFEQDIQGKDKNVANELIAKYVSDLAAGKAAAPVVQGEGEAKRKKAFKSRWKDDPAKADRDLANNLNERLDDWLFGEGKGKPRFDSGELKLVKWQNDVNAVEKNRDANDKPMTIWGQSEQVLQILKQLQEFREYIDERDAKYLTEELSKRGPEFIRRYFDEINAWKVVNSFFSNCREEYADGTLGYNSQCAKRVDNSLRETLADLEALAKGVAELEAKATSLNQGIQQKIAEEKEKERLAEAKIRQEFQGKKKERDAIFEKYLSDHKSFFDALKAKNVDSQEAYKKALDESSSLASMIPRDIRNMLENDTDNFWSSYKTKVSNERTAEEEKLLNIDEKRLNPFLFFLTQNYANVHKAQENADYKQWKGDVSADEKPYYSYVIKGGNDFFRNKPLMAVKLYFRKAENKSKVMGFWQEFLDFIKGKGRTVESLTLREMPGLYREWNKQNKKQA